MNDLKKSCEIAKAHLVNSQSRMKVLYDRKSVTRTFQPGESVLILLREEAK